MYGIYIQFGNHVCFWHIYVKQLLQLVAFCAPVLGLYATQCDDHCGLYLQCDSHIFSLIYVSNKIQESISTVFLVTCLMLVTSCVAHICKDMVCVCSCVGIFISGICMALTFELNFVVDSVVAHDSTNGRPTCPCRIRYICNI